VWFIGKFLGFQLLWNCAYHRFCNVCQKNYVWHWFVERSETAKSSPLISEESEKLAETAVECDEEPSSPSASAVPPDSEGSNAEEEMDKETQVTDILPSTAETNA